MGFGWYFFYTCPGLPSYFSLFPFIHSTIISFNLICLMHQLVSNMLCLKAGLDPSKASACSERFYLSIDQLSSPICQSIVEKSYFFANNYKDILSPVRLILRLDSIRNTRGTPRGPWLQWDIDPCPRFIKL